MLAILAALTLIFVIRPEASSQAGRAVTRKVAVRTVAALPAPDLLRPLAPEEAIEENAERPFSGRPDTAAAAFAASKQKADDRARALKCLAQAIYYEAASEGADGQRAVAQVVLNRVRHPGYPSSVCGVVYQGSERTTGCQFSFTCDGSLKRPPAQSLWRQAEQLAKEALAGKVFAPVGHSTHYHADYVLPYWADSLDKSVQIGRHLFYRLPGTVGSARAFSQRYARKEPEPPSPTQAEVVAEAIDQVLPAENSLEPTLLAPSEPAAIVPPNSPLAADITAGALVIDGDAARPTTRKSTRGTECAASEDSKQVKALGANDLRTGRSAAGCE